MPREQYYFDPFNPAMPEEDSSRLRYTEKWNSCVIAEKNLPVVPRRGTLLIDGHGARNGVEIRNKYKDADQKISATDLAIMLKGSLPIDHIKIRLLACYGGTGMAEMLAYYLGSYGYKSIAVGGYNYSFYHGTINTRALIAVADGVEVENFSNSGYLTWFDMNGTKIAKPDIPPAERYDPFLGT